MWSEERSALLPSSVTVCPFTLTRPCVINSSALRREAIPAAAMIFCRRSAGTSASRAFRCDLASYLFVRFIMPRVGGDGRLGHVLGNLSPVFSHLFHAAVFRRCAGGVS